MKPLSAARQEILKRVRDAQQILLLLDYDGTLVPIRSHPGLAKLSASQEKLLERLSASAKFKIGIVTGRSLKDIRKTVGLSGLVYSANHGLEIAIGKRRWVHPKANAASPLINKTASRLRRIFRAYAGVRVEDKGLTLAVHYRRFSGKPSLLKHKMLEIMQEHAARLILTHGKKIYEIRPAVAWGKGKSLTKIEKMLGYRKKPLVIFIGDDMTDEDAFGLMSKSDISILVGNRRKSAARFKARSRKAVYLFLGKLKK